MDRNDPNLREAMKKTIIKGMVAVLAVLTTCSCRTTPPPTMTLTSFSGPGMSSDIISTCREFSKSPKFNRLSQAEKLRKLFELDQQKQILMLRTSIGQKQPVTEATVSSLLGQPEYRQQNDHGYWVVYTIGKDTHKRTLLVFDFVDEKLSDVQQFAFTTA